MRLSDRAELDGNTLEMRSCRPDNLKSRVSHCAPRPLSWDVFETCPFNILQSIAGSNTRLPNYPVHSCADYGQLDVGCSCLASSSHFGRTIRTGDSATCPAYGQTTVNSCSKLGYFERSSSTILSLRCITFFIPLVTSYNG